MKVLNTISVIIAVIAFQATPLLAQTNPEPTPSAKSTTPPEEWGDDARIMLCLAANAAAELTGKAIPHPECESKEDETIEMPEQKISPQTKRERIRRDKLHKKLGLSKLSLGDLLTGESPSVQVSRAMAFASNTTEKPVLGEQLAVASPVGADKSVSSGQ